MALSGWPARHQRANQCAAGCHPPLPAGGQSGSSLWTPNLAVRAIHSSSGGGASFHRSMTREVFDLVKAWRDSPTMPTQ